MALGPTDERDALDLKLRALPGIRVDLQSGIRRDNYLPGVCVWVARNAGGENHDLANAHMLTEIREVFLGKLALDIRDDLCGSAQGIHAQQDIEIALVPGCMALGDGLGNHAGKALECPLVHAARSDVYALKKSDDLGVGGAVNDIEVVDARGFVDIMTVGHADVVVALSLKLAHTLHVHVIQVQAVSCAGEEQADNSPADLSRTENRNLTRGFFSRHKIQSSLCRLGDDAQKTKDDADDEQAKQKRDHIDLLLGKQPVAQQYEAKRQNLGAHGIKEALDRGGVATRCVRDGEGAGEVDVERRHGADGSKADNARSVGDLLHDARGLSLLEQLSTHAVTALERPPTADKLGNVEDQHEEDRAQDVAGRSHADHNGRRDNAKRCVEKRVANGGKGTHKSGLDTGDRRGIEVIVRGVLLFHSKNDAQGQTAKIRGHVEVLVHMTLVSIDTLLFVVRVDLLERRDDGVGKSSVHLARIVVHAIEVDVATVNLRQVFVRELAVRGLIRTHCHHLHQQ